MKKVLALLMCLSVAAQGAQGGRVVFDTRTLEPLKDHATPVSPSTRQKVVKDIFGSKPGCDVVVADELTGAFTRKGTKQKAYLVFGCETSHLVIYEGGKVAKKINNIGNNIGNIGDINRDGMDDLLFRSVRPMAGPSIFDVSVVTVAGGRFKTLFDLSKAFVKECEGTSGFMQAHRMTVVPAPKPSFTLETYKSKCDQRDFRLISTRKVQAK